MRVVVSGLNNYVGSRCTGLMGDEDFHVFAIARNVPLFQSRVFEPIVAELCEIDLMRADFAVKEQLPDMHAAYYFTQVPTLDDKVNMNLELLCLRNYIHLIHHMHCNRLIYVARLMDKGCIAPILELFRECNVDYTVVLKSSVIGKGSLIDKVIKHMAGKKVMLYSRYYLTREFKPLGVRDFVGWLKRLLNVDAFHHKVVEVGGNEAFSLRGLYKLYLKLELLQGKTRFVRMPAPIMSLFYRSRLSRASVDFEELDRFISFERETDSTWQQDAPFAFSPMEKVLREDR